MKHLYFTLSIVAFAVVGFFAVTTFNISDIEIAYAGDGGQGTPWTICASSCDFETISEAFSATTTIASGDYFEVQDTYASSTENGDIYFPYTDVHLSCNTGGNSVQIGGTGVSEYAMYLSSDSSISNCTFNNVRFVLSADENVTISENTINVYEAHSNTLSLANGSNNLSFATNTVNYEDTTAEGFGCDDGSGNYLVLVEDSADPVFAGNTFNFPANRCEMADFIDMNTSDSGAIAFTFTHNIINSAVQNARLTIGPSFFGAQNPINATITHNTWYTGKQLTVISMSAASTTINATTTYNIFYTSTTTNPFSILLSSNKVTSSTLYYDYNVDYGFNGLRNSGNPFTVTNPGNSFSDRPWFRIENGNTADDFTLNPMSILLDANGNLDVGAVSGVRATSGTIDPSCTFANYTTCIATTTEFMEYNARSGDTFTLSAGSFVPFTLTADNVTISGAGATSIIDAALGAETDAIYLNGNDNTTIQNVKIQNATSTSGTYTASVMTFAYGGNDYNDGGLLAPIYEDAMIYTAGSSCGNLTFTATAPDITAHTSNGTDNWHIALIDAGGGVKVTGIISDGYFSNESALETSCGITVDLWIADAFVASEGAYTYASSTVSGAGASVVSGFTDPPAISAVFSGGSGVYITNGSGNTIVNATFDNNYYAVNFGTGAVNNVVGTSTMTNTLGYDGYSDSTSDNYFNNLTRSGSDYENNSGRIIVDGVIPSGGDAVPDMSFYMTMLVIALGGWYVWREQQREQELV